MHENFLGVFEYRDFLKGTWTISRGILGSYLLERGIFRPFGIEF